MALVILINNHTFPYNMILSSLYLCIVTVHILRKIYDILFILKVCVISIILSKFWYLFILKRTTFWSSLKLHNKHSTWQATKHWFWVLICTFFFSSPHNILKHRHTIFIFFANKWHCWRKYWSYFFFEFFSVQSSQEREPVLIWMTWPSRQE